MLDNIPTSFSDLDILIHEFSKILEFCKSLRAVGESAGAVAEFFNEYGNTAKFVIDYVRTHPEAMHQIYLENHNAGRRGIYYHLGV